MMGNLNDNAIVIPVVTNSWKMKMENKTVWRSETARRFSTNRHDTSKSNTKSGGKGRTDKECFRCGRIGHIRADEEPTSHGEAVEDVVDD